jgi:hypothetical protein
MKLKNGLLCSALALMAFTGAVQAQELGLRARQDYETPYPQPQRGQSVFERPRPDFEPNAIRYRSFIISPSVAFDMQYDDNIFTADDDGGDTVSDFILQARPGVRVSSDWNRHSLVLRSALRGATYLENEQQDFTDFLGGANGQFDITRNFNATAGYTYQELHEERSSPNAATANNDVPTEYSLATVNAGLTRSVGLIGFDLDLNRLRWDYDNTLLSTQNDRDRSDDVGALRLSYEFRPDYRYFIEGQLNQRNYDQDIDDNGFRRDSEGYRAITGTDFDITSLLSGDIYVGYAAQDYGDDPRFDVVDSIVYGSNLLWDMTPLTSVRLSVDKSIQDSVTPSVAAYIATVYKVEVQHELLRNVLIGSDVQYRNYEYEGFNIDREDHLYEAGLGGRYLVGRNVTLGAEYRFFTRDTDAVASDFRENTVTTSIGFRF